MVLPFFKGELEGISRYRFYRAFEETQKWITANR